MNNQLARGLMLGVVGIIIGSTMGVVALGDGVNGAVVFGPLGFLIGWLMPQNVSPFEEKQEIAEAKDVEPKSQDYKNVETSIDEIIPIVGRLLVSIWNLQMRGLIAVGLMEQIKKQPWLLFASEILLLALIFPLGIISTISGFAAMHYGASVSNSFMVETRPA